MRVPVAPALRASRHGMGVNRSDSRGRATEPRTKTGSASITMKKDGTIVIKGKDITIDGSGKINIKASSDIVMKGSKILQN